MTLEDGEKVGGRLLIGTDGANSVVARHLSLPGTRYRGYVGYRCGAVRLCACSVGRGLDWQLGHLLQAIMQSQHMGFDKCKEYADR